MVRLERNKRAKLGWICGLKLDDSICIVVIRTKLEIVDLETAIHCVRLRWFGHVETTFK